MREPFIEDRLEELLPRAFGRTAQANDMLLLAVGMMPDHIHAVVRYPSRLSTSEIARLFKGSSSHLAKRVVQNEQPLYVSLQREFGVISVGDDSLDRVVDCVRNQKQRHAQNTLIEAFEVLEKQYLRAPSAGGAL